MPGRRCARTAGHAKKVVVLRKTITPVASNPTVQNPDYLRCCAIPIRSDRHMPITLSDETTHPAGGHPQPGIPEWKSLVAKFQQPSARRATWQIVNSFGPYALVWYSMYLSLAVSWWLTLPLAILAGGLLVRIFIIFHDCGHGSFFKSRLANDVRSEERRVGKEC